MSKLKLSERLQNIAIKHGFIKPGLPSQDNLKAWDFLVDIVKEVGKEDKEQARRFALLRAATALYEVSTGFEDMDCKRAVRKAYRLLEEIETRENDVTEVRTADSK